MNRAVSIFGVLIFVVFMTAFNPAQAGKKFYPAPVEKPFNLMDSFTKLNRLKPLQNPQYKKSASVLNRSVIDRQNKLIGTAQNMLVGPDGSVSALEVSFDRLRLDQTVFLNYESTKITPASNGFKIGLEGTQIAAMYPELIAGIETASGNSEIISIKDTIGVSIVDASNVVVGNISDVLFDDKLSRAEGFYVTLASGSVNARAAAVPFRIVTFEDNNGVLRGRMSNSDIGIMKNFARD